MKFLFLPLNHSGDHVAPMVVGLSQVNDVTAGLLAAAATRPALAALLMQLVDCAGKSQLNRCEDKLQIVHVE